MGHVQGGSREKGRIAEDAARIPTGHCETGSDDFSHGLGRPGRLGLEYGEVAANRAPAANYRRPSPDAYPGRGRGASSPSSYVLRLPFVHHLSPGHAAPRSIHFLFSFALDPCLYQFSMFELSSWPKHLISSHVRKYPDSLLPRDK